MRAAGNFGKVDATLRDKALSLTNDESRDVQLQVVIAAKKFDSVDPFPVYLRVLNACGDDPLIPHIVWQNLHPLLENKADAFLTLLEMTDLGKSPNLKALMPRVIERVLGRQKGDPAAIVALFDLFSGGKNADVGLARTCLWPRAGAGGKIQNGEITGEPLNKLKGQLEPILTRHLDGKPEDPLYFDSALLATTLKEPPAFRWCARRSRPRSAPKRIDSKHSTRSSRRTTRNYWTRSAPCWQRVRSSSASRC